MTDRHDQQPYPPAHGSKLPEPPSTSAAHEHAEGAPAHGHSRSEEDVVQSAKIVWVGVGALVVFFIASLATAGYFRLKQGERPKLPIPAEVGQSKVGMVEQQLFEIAARGENERQTKLEKLHGYGWVDRDKGLAHMPIDKAMELAAKGVRAPSTAPGGAPSPGGAL